MRRTKFLLATTAVAASFVATALPASAATSGTTVTTFALTGGALNLTVAATATLPSAAAGNASVSGPLGTVTVSDQRGGLVGWTASANSTTFTTTAGDTPSTSISYAPGLPTTTGVAIVAPTPTATLTTTPTAVMSATGIIGTNSATWNPTLTVNLPTSALAGTYTGTVTTSVA